MVDSFEHDEPVGRVDLLACDIRPAAAIAGSPSDHLNGYVSQSPHGTPTDSADPGMSSTPSIMSTSVSWSAGRTGANPTPQLPKTTVDTPFLSDGSSASSHLTCPSSWVCRSTNPGVTKRRLRR